MKIATFFVVAMQLVWALIAAFSLLMIMVSPMMFDAPGSEHNPRVLMAFYSLLSFPVVVVACEVVATFLNRSGKSGQAIAVLLIPAINIFLSLWW